MIVNIKSSLFSNVTEWFSSTKPVTIGSLGSSKAETIGCYSEMDAASDGSIGDSETTSSLVSSDV